MRRLATDVGTSTTAVYSLFGSKSELVRAVFQEGFRRLGGRLDAVELTGDPAVDLLRLGAAYRDSALADPHLYAVMFGRVIPEFEPEADDMAIAVGTMSALTAAVEAARQQALLGDAPTTTIVMALWAVVHGLVSLELGTFLPEGFDVAAHYHE